MDESEGNGFLFPRKLRVAIVAPSLRILGGQAVQAHRLLRAWEQDEDIEAWLVPVNPVPRGAVARLLESSTCGRLVTQLVYWPLLFRELKRADVVHVFSASYSSFLLAPLPAILAARWIGRPVILNYRSGEAPDHLKRSAIARAAIASVERTLVPSRFLLDVFGRSACGPWRHPEHRRSGAIQVPRTRAAPAAHPVDAQFRGLYNVACTLRAFKRVQKRWPDASLTLVGGGPLEKQLRALAAELQLEHVDFVGRVRPDEIADYYAAHDIYVQTPNIDNMPTSILEAYASGLPVVSTDAGGVPAILTDGEHGLLAPLDDDVALAGRILKLLEQPGVARELAQNAYTMCRAFSWQQVREQWLSHYQQVWEKYERQPALRVGLNLGAK